MPTGIKITKQQEKDLINTYLVKPISIKKIGEKFGFCSPTVIRILNKYNIPRYKKAQIFNPDMNEHYFESIDSEAKAYFLGFIITDGNIFVSDGRQASISITQLSKDEYILQKFKDEIGINTIIGHDGRGCSQVAVRSDIMANDLLKYGICAVKTLETYLPILNDKYMPHLIRGILDGDGNIKAYQTKINNRFAHALSFCGTNRLMNDIGDYLAENLNVKRNKVYDYSDKHLSEIKWQSKDDIKAIGDWIYGSATIYLQRKYDSYKTFKEHYY